MISYLQKPSESSVLVIATADAPDAGDKLHIAAQKYAKCLSFSRPDENDDFSTFKLLDEIGFKKQKQALKTLLMLLQSGKGVYEILGVVAWYIRRLGRVKRLLGNGVPEKDIAYELKLGYDRARKVIEQAKNFTLEELKTAQQLLIETDENAKKSTLKPDVMLQVLVVRLCSDI